MLGRKLQGDSSEQIIEDIGQTGEHPSRKVDDMSLVSSVQELTRLALIRRGYDKRTADGRLASTAAALAGHILLAELRHSQVLPEGAALGTAEMLEAHSEVRERLGVALPEPMGAE